MKDHFIMVKNKEKEDSSGLTEKYMMVNEKWAINMDRVCGEGIKEIVI